MSAASSARLCGGGLGSDEGDPTPHLPGQSSWSLLELPPSPGVRPGRLAGFHRASPSTPLDASSYVIGKSSGSQQGFGPPWRTIHNVMPTTDEPLSTYAEPAAQPLWSSHALAG